MKILSTILLLFSFTVLANEQHAKVIENAIDFYKNDALAKERVEAIKHKGSETNLCTFVQKENGISAKIISVTNYPGDRFITLLITDEFQCTTLNNGIVDELTDIYNLTSIIKINENPKETKFDLLLLSVPGQDSLDKLPAAISL